MITHRTATLVAGLFGLTPLAGCSRSSAAPPEALPPAAVQTVLPWRGEITRSVTLPSFRILAWQQATLHAKVTGYLRRLTVDKGDKVRSGQLLAEIEVPEIRADEAEYLAEAEVAGTNLARMARARRTAPDLVVPQTVDDLRGQRDVARARLQRIRVLLRYAQIRAPFSGVITARFMDPGALVPAGSSGTPPGGALVTLEDLSRLRVQVYVPQMEVRFVRDGLPAALTVEGLPGQTFHGVVSRFAYALDEATKSMLTEIEVRNPRVDLRPGMYASVRLRLERKRHALLVPATAVTRERTGSFVFVAAGGRAQRRGVRTGFADGRDVEVRDGLRPGEPVILAGRPPLHDGQPIEIRGQR
jgi:membrane fusion protein, multidrug efflux system